MGCFSCMAKLVEKLWPSKKALNSSGERGEGLRHTNLGKDTFKRDNWKSQEKWLGMQDSGLNQSHSSSWLLAVVGIKYSWGWKHWRLNYVASNILDVLHVLSHWNLTTVLHVGFYYCPHFIDKEMEAQEIRSLAKDLIHSVWVMIPVTLTPKPMVFSMNLCFHDSQIKWHIVVCEIWSYEVGPKAQVDRALHPGSRLDFNIRLWN